MRVTARFVNRIEDIPGAAWNALIPDPYPFVRHEFLAALERHGCVTESTGWEPHHLLIESNDSLQAAAPLYLKMHSYGEFVFDWSWAEASRRLGRPYYPKLLCAIPFNPVTGLRLLAPALEQRAALANTIREEAQRLGLSSAHALFLQGEDVQAFADAGFLLRRDCHYEWLNRDYVSFDDFLATLSSERRKKIRRERRRVTEAGLVTEVLAGREMSEALWHDVYRFYANTYEERGQAPYLSLPCLLDWGEKLGDALRVFLVRDGPEPVAAAICFVAGDTLYGRHWGCAEHYHSLHFETCYYQGIEYCIRQRLRRFDAGAQGEHKLHRGFEPVITRSAHWLADAPLRRAVESFLQREGLLVEAYAKEKLHKQQAAQAPSGS